MENRVKQVVDGEAINQDVAKPVWGAIKFQDGRINNISVRLENLTAQVGNKTQVITDLNRVTEDLRRELLQNRDGNGGGRVGDHERDRIHGFFTHEDVVIDNRHENRGDPRGHSFLHPNTIRAVGGGGSVGRDGGGGDASGGGGGVFGGGGEDVPIED